MATPVRELDVSPELVTLLLQMQHPDLASLPVRAAGEGWDNFTFRLGDLLAVRIPRRAIAVGLIEHEQRWLPEIADRVTIPIPAPVRVGTPSKLFPWPWSVVPWIEGTTAVDAQPLPDQASALSSALRSLHTSPPADAPTNPFRGGRLSGKSEVFESRIVTATNDRLDLGIPIDSIERLWRQLMVTPIDVPPTWIHGDLHAKNVIVQAGRLASILDWGDITAGDPATDLSAVWSLFEPDGHQVFWDGYGEASVETRNRSRCWALYFATVWIVDGGDDLEFVTMGRRTLRRLMSV